MTNPLPKAGFTLAELLIALAILGVIATFTIPKVLQSQQDSKYKAIAKEAAATISAAYDAYRLKTTPTATTRPDDLTPYINYVKLDSATWLDDVPTAGPGQCSGECMVLHNGGMLAYNPGQTFAGTASTNGISFWLDPDGGTKNGSSAGPVPSVSFILYWNGRLATQGTALPNTQNSDWNLGATNPARDPSWFGWN